MAAFDMSGCIVRDLVAEPDDALLDKIYHRVLEPAFQPGELEPLQVIRLQIADRRVLRMQAMFDADSEPVAVVTSDWYARSEVLLIGYLAVREDLRGRGIGTKLIQNARSKWLIDPGPALAVAEVEDPRYFQASATGDPVARLRLYEKQLGARIIAVPYFQPRLSEELSRVYHLMLMAFGVNSRELTEADKSIPTARIGVFLDEYFEAAEGPQAWQDPEFLELKSRVLSLPEAPLLSSDELDRLPVL